MAGADGGIHMVEQTTPRLAIVTGASGGVGRSTAIALGAAGWNVAVGARRPDELAETAALVEKAGGRALAAPLDISDPDSVDQFFATVTRELGPPDALVNNASVASLGVFHEQSAADLERDVRINVLGTMFCSRAMVRSLLERDAGGDVLFVSSESALGPFPSLVGYGATKAAIEALAKGLELELEGKGVRVSIVRIGPTFSDFSTGWRPGALEAVMQQWPYYGIGRHFGVMFPENIADSIVHVLNLPEGVRIPQLDLRPTPPVGSAP
jgi:NADP-dependent 3-hydroxy acid dehydrogenase YdfG